MNCKYGQFTNEQFEKFKEKLHSKIHWLLVYKEDKCDFLSDYFETTMQYIGGLNEILEHNSLIIDLLVTLQVALDESKKSNCNFKIYRKNILEAHNIIERL